MNQRASDAKWQEPAHEMSETSLKALLAGEVPAIRVAGFAAAEECHACCDAIRHRAACGQAAETSSMTLFGANFSNYTGSTKDGYFDQVTLSYETVGSVLADAGFDPLQRMIEQLRAVWKADVEVAREPGFGRYFAGGIKTRATSGHLHYDFAPHTAPGYAIAAIVDQLGWNLYLDMPEGTGETTTYRRSVPRDGGKVGTGSARALNLTSDFVDGAETFTFRPEIGEMVIINTRYPHDIKVDTVDAEAWRVQISSFIGRLPDDSLILWS